MYPSHATFQYAGLIEYRVRKFQSFKRLNYGRVSWKVMTLTKGLFIFSVKIRIICLGFDLKPKKEKKVSSLIYSLG